MSDILYLKAEKHVKVKTQTVKIKDITKLECANVSIKNEINAKSLKQIYYNREHQGVIPSLQLMEARHSNVPE